MQPSVSLKSTASQPNLVQIVPPTFHATLSLNNLKSNLAIFQNYNTNLCSQPLTDSQVAISNSECNWFSIWYLNLNSFMIQ